MRRSTEGELVFFTRRLPEDLKKIEVVPTGDLHYGNPMCALEHFRKHINEIAESSNRYTILMGDLCEVALRDTKGGVYDQVATPQGQRDFLIRELAPIAGRILGSVTGNHEMRILERCGLDISKDIATALNIPYRPEGIIIKVVFGSGNEGHPKQPYTYHIYATHGYGGARTAAAKAVKVERTSTFVSGCDAYIMGHDHVVNAASRVELVPDHRSIMRPSCGFEVGTVTARKIKLVKSNSFLKWAGYAEMGGFSPSDLDTPVIILNGEGRRSVRVIS